VRFRDVRGWAGTSPKVLHGAETSTTGRMADPDFALLEHLADAVIGRPSRNMLMAGIRGSQSSLPSPLHRRPKGAA
jgi:hypothetical protein